MMNRGVEFKEVPRITHSDISIDLSSEVSAIKLEKDKIIVEEEFKQPLNEAQGYEEVKQDTRVIKIEEGLNPLKSKTSFAFFMFVNPASGGNRAAAYTKLQVMLLLMLLHLIFALYKG